MATDILSEYIQLTNEHYSYEESTKTVTVGRRSASGMSVEDAHKNFINQYNIVIALNERKRQQTAQDYVKYGKKNLLPFIKIKMNDPSFFEKKHSLLAVDSEGHKKNGYPEIIQFAVSKTDVYIFEVLPFIEQIKSILTDENVLKTVFDLGAEERAFGIKYKNVVDLQKPREGFVKMIYDCFGVSLKKNKRVHIIGWDAKKLTYDQVCYSAFDVVWMYRLYVKLYY